MYEKLNATTHLENAQINLSDNKLGKEGICKMELPDIEDHPDSKISPNADKLDKLELPDIDDFPAFNDNVEQNSENLSFDLDVDEPESKPTEPVEISEKTQIDISNVPFDEREKILNAEDLSPNTVYKMPNGDVYETDDKGRIVKKVFIPFINEDRRTPLDSKNTQEVGKSGIEGDHGGHIQAHSLGGSSDKINLFPQNGNFNTGEYKKIENGIRKDLEDRRTVKVEVGLIYSDASIRPSQVRVTKEVTDSQGNTEIISLTRNNAPKEGQNYA